ncbi:hypothetical protein [Streptomyces sp. NPDC087300]|uniref:hypothetical protein n=1 Tax=Streptomyces sp. NPDC087300 TaxID=3365780 RepID=UPI0038142DE4
MNSTLEGLTAEVLQAADADIAWARRIEFQVPERADIDVRVERLTHTMELILDTAAPALGSTERARTYETQLDRARAALRAVRDRPQDTDHQAWARARQLAEHVALHLALRRARRSP